MLRSRPQGHACRSIGRAQVRIDPPIRSRRSRTSLRSQGSPPNLSRPMRRIGLTLFVVLAACDMSMLAQGPSESAAQQVSANLNQLMRGVLYPAANVVFFAQADNPGDVKPIPGQDPSMATDPLTSTFGGWPAVENAALALAESGNLLSIPGRTCSNGVPVPIKDPSWAMFVQELRDAS